MFPFLHTKTEFLLAGLVLVMTYSTISSLCDAQFGKRSVGNIFERNRLWENWKMAGRIGTIILFWLLYLLTGNLSHVFLAFGVLLLVPKVLYAARPLIQSSEESL